MAILVSSDSQSNASDLKWAHGMTSLKHPWRRLLALWRSERIHSEINEELAFHIDQRTQDNVRAGMPPEEARREAERRFGWMSRIKEDAYEVRGGRWMESLLSRSEERRVGKEGRARWAR